MGFQGAVLTSLDAFGLKQRASWCAPDLGEFGEKNSEITHEIMNCGWILK